MNRLVIVLVGVLACTGSVTPTEPPQGPWQTLNPSLGTPAQAKPQRDEVALTPEEEFLVNNIPFKLPFKMDKKQTAVAMKLMKEAVKPIIKSKTLQETVSYVDDLLHFLVDDIETQMYMTLFLDFMQDVYEGKEREQVDKIVRSFIHGNSDQATARTIGDVWSRYMSESVHDYFFTPMRSYVVRPISNAVSTFAERIGTWMGNGRRPYDAEPYAESSYGSWSKRVNSYARRLSSWTRQARQGLFMAAHVLEDQDQARACLEGGCGPSYPAEESVSVQVMDVTLWVVAGGGLLVAFSYLLAAAVAAAIAVPLGVAVPLASAGTGPTGTASPTGPGPFGTGATSPTALGPFGTGAFGAPLGTGPPPPATGPVFADPLLGVAGGLGSTGTGGGAPSFTGVPVPFGGTARATSPIFPPTAAVGLTAAAAVGRRAAVTSTSSRY